jgi:hypothetical protein
MNVRVRPSTRLYSSILRILPRVLAFAAVMLILVGAWVYWEGAHASKPGNWLLVSPAVLVLHGLKVDELRPAVFTLSNRNSGISINILGSGDTCTPNGCYKVHPIPVSIPAGGSAKLTVDYSSYHSGHFVCEVSIYTDIPGQAEFLLRIDAEVTSGDEPVSVHLR